MTRKLLLLDDDELFRKQISEALREKGFDVLAPKIATQEILECWNQQPDDVLADIKLGTMDIQTLLTRFQNKGVDWGKVRIWLVTGLDDPPITELKENFPSIQNWFRKPLRVNDLVAALKKFEGEKETFSLPDALRHHPFPLRVLDGDLRVVHASDYWAAQAINRPAPRHFSGFKDKTPGVFEFYSLIPLLVKGDRKHESQFYRLHSFPINEKEYLVQIAEPLRPAGFVMNWRYYVDRMFQAMQESGFHRARFYRVIPVPGSTGLMQLVMEKNSVYAAVSLPQLRPVHGQLEKRLKGYERQQRPENDDLVTSIRSQDDNDPNDPDIQFWNSIINVQGLQSWLEVPLLKLQEKDSQKTYLPIGLFIFDRMGGKGLIQDGTPQKVTKDQVEKVQATLRYMLKEVVRAIDLEEREKDQKLWNTLAALDDTLFCEVRREVIEKALLQAAVDITNAQGGLLITREGAAVTLGVRAAIGKIQESLKGAGIALNQTVHPVVQCWESGEPVYLPDFRNSSVREELLKNTSYTALGSHPEQLRDWFDRGIGSLVALPIVSGEEKVGAISLQHPEAYYFHKGRVQALKGLLHRVRWFLHAAKRDDDRSNWEYSLMHEILSLSSTVKKDVRKGLEKCSAPPPALRRALAQIQSLEDLSHNFMDTHGNPRTGKEGSFQEPGKIVKEFLDGYRDIMERNRQAVMLLPACDDDLWHLHLQGNREAFGRVVRTLLDNALKYGGRDATIHLYVQVEDDLWQLAIDNPGCLGETELKEAFTPHFKSDDPQYDGAHVGLAASRNVAQAAGGALTLKNIIENGHKKVVTTLTWPLAKENV